MSESDLPIDRIQVRKDAIVTGLPEGSNPDTRHWRGGGLFHADGRPDLAAAPMMVAQPALGSERLEGAESLPEGIFCGRFRGHFGHFLAESIGRLWAVEALPPDLPLIWFSDPRQTGTGGIRKRILAALAISNPQIIVSSTLKVDRLHLPPSLTDPLYQITPSPAYQAWFTRHLPPAPDLGRDIYISRAKLPDKAGRFFGESAIEAGLRAEGYRVVYPELLSIEEQIAACRAARRVVVAEGSPLHLLALLDVPGQKIATLMRRPRIVDTLKPALLAFRDSQFLLIDRIAKTWGAGATGNLFNAVSELDLDGVWADLAEHGFTSASGAKPVPDAAALKVERLARAPERKVRLAIDKRDL
jgi:hypothetical protein